MTSEHKALSSLECTTLNEAEPCPPGTRRGQRDLRVRSFSQGLTTGWVEGGDATDSSASLPMRAKG